MCKSIFITRFIRPIYENYFNLKPLFSDKIIKQPNQIVYVKVNNLNWSIYPSPKCNIEWLKSNQSIELPKSQKVRPKKKLLMTYVRKRGMIRGGDWDQKKYNFKKEVPYIALNKDFYKTKDGVILSTMIIIKN